MQRNGIEVARAVVGVNKEDGSLVFAGNIKEGETATFGYGDINR